MFQFCHLSQFNCVILQVLFWCNGILLGFLTITFKSKIFGGIEVGRWWYLGRYQIVE